MRKFIMIEFNSYPAVAEIVRATLDVWPEHRKYLDLRFKDFSQADLPTAEAVAKITLALAAIVEGGLRQLCLDYRYLCEELILPEELYFRRNGRYRLSSFSDAFEQVYS